MKISKYTIMLLVGLIILVVVGALVTLDVRKPKAITKQNPQVVGVSLGGGSMLSSNTVAQNIALAPGLSTFEELLALGKLSEVLADRGPFTVIAPSNAAFAALPVGELERLKLPENQIELGTLLASHIVPGRLQLADLKDGQQLFTMSGSSLLVSKSSEGIVKIAGFTVEEHDAGSSNGIIHLLSGVATGKAL